MEQRLQLKLEGNTNANLCISGTEFQSVLVGGENAQAFVRIKVRELPKHSVLTDHRKAWFPLHVKCYDHDDTKTKRLKG